MARPVFVPADDLARERELRAHFEAYVAHRARSTSKARALRPLRKDSAEVYRKIWGTFARYCAQRSISLESLDGADLDCFVASLGTRGEVSTRYAWRVLSLVNKVICFDAEHRGIARNTAAETLLQNVIYRHANGGNQDFLPGFLTGAESERVILYVSQIANDSQAIPASWNEVRNRTAVAVQLGAGLTPGEVRALPIECVGTEGRHSAELPAKISLPGNANSPARETPIASWAARQLVSWLSVRREQGIGGSLVFPATMSGKPWKRSSIYLACRSVLKRAGVADPDGGSYKLRHTFAIRQLKRGKADAEVAAWLGVHDLAVIARYHRVLDRPGEAD
jgi:integrase